MQTTISRVKPLSAACAFRKQETKQETLRLSACLQVTLPDLDESFALIFSTERGGKVDSSGRVGVQVMGLNDGYIAQTGTDIGAFWADRENMALGTCFQPAEARQFGDVPKNAVDEVSPNCVSQNSTAA